MKLAHHESFVRSVVEAFGPEYNFEFRPDGAKVSTEVEFIDGEVNRMAHIFEAGRETGSSERVASMAMVIRDAREGRGYQSIEAFAHYASEKAVKAMIAGLLTLAVGLAFTALGTVGWLIIDFCRKFFIH